MKYRDKGLRAIWGQRLVELNGSGLSGRAWCARQGISYHKYRYWKDRIESSEREGDIQPVQWLALDSTSYGSGSGMDVGITVRIGAAVVDVRKGFDPELLRGIVQALSST